MKPYMPDFLPLKKLDWMKFIHLIGPANSELARYDGIIHGIVNPNVLVSPLTTKEAVLSSRIEGTQATLVEVLEFEASQKTNIKTEREKDIQEIINYLKSIMFATDWINVKPVTLNMIKKVHFTLLDSVRGRNKGLGEFRSVQNWIGKPGMPMVQADYIPPEPMKLIEYLSNFEKYIHFKEKDFLVQLAVIHAQFEIIHPFIDGNGRVGRILIPLFLFEKKLLSSPIFYISEYLESHRDEYCNRLREITQENKWEEWVKFFLKAIYEQAKLNSNKAKLIIKLYNQKKERIQSITHSQYLIKILDSLFTRPIFSTTYFIKESGIPKRSALRFLNIMEKEGIISVLRPGKGRKATIFMFRKLIKIIG